MQHHKLLNEVHEDFGKHQENTFIVSWVFPICSPPKKSFTEIKNFKKRRFLGDILPIDKTCQESLHLLQYM